MEEKILNEIYDVKTFDYNELNVGKITEKEKLIAAKQILLGIGIIYVLTMLAYIICPERGYRLVDICNTTLPPIVTLILVSYFRDKP